MKEGRGEWEGEEEEAASTVVSAQFDFYVIKKMMSSSILGVGC